jgi:hypothetical protein
MGLFDTYELRTAPGCDECGEAMSSCQGKDGPCVLATFREGEARLSLALRVDEAIGSLDPLGLPMRFRFSCYCVNGHSQDYVGECIDGVWTRTVRAAV